MNYVGFLFIIFFLAALKFICINFLDERTARFWRDRIHITPLFLYLFYSSLFDYLGLEPGFVVLSTLVIMMSARNSS